MGRCGQRWRTGSRWQFWPKTPHFHGSWPVRKISPRRSISSAWGVSRLSAHPESTCSTLPMSDQTLGRASGVGVHTCIHTPGPREPGGTPFVIKSTPFVIKFVLYVLPLVLWMYSTYFTLYSAHDVYSVCTLRTPRCAPKVHSEYRQSTLYSTRPMRVHSEYMAHFEVQSTQ